MNWCKATQIIVIYLRILGIIPILGINCYEYGFIDMCNLTRWYRWFSTRLRCLVHPGVRDKCRASEIELSKPRKETAFWWRHNGPMTSQLTGSNKWPNYPWELIGIYVHINTHNKESLAQRCGRSTNVQLCLIFLYIYMVWVLMDGMPYFASQITVTTSP